MNEKLARPGELGQAGDLILVFFFFQYLLISGHLLTFTNF